MIRRLRGVKFQQRDDGRITCGRGDVAALIGAGEDCEVPLRGDPDGRVVHRVGAVMQQYRAAGPSSRRHGPPQRIVATEGRRRQFLVGGARQ